MEGLALPIGGVPRGPNCGVTAVAVICGVSFETAWLAFRAFYPSPNWQGRTSTVYRTKVLNALGCRAIQHYLKRRVTLANWVKKEAGLGTYLVLTAGHVQVVRGHYVLDQRGPCHIDKYWGRNKRVQQFHAVFRAPA